MTNFVFKLATVNQRDQNQRSAINSTVIVFVWMDLMELVAVE